MDRTLRTSNGTKNFRSVSTSNESTKRMNWSYESNWKSREHRRIPKEIFPLFVKHHEAMKNV
ncbi:CLUMA_CG002806, isoform A [Clunio marinus]|uniref:CLUMA_CG002806, isoform A n=1 Tax=Clunio marinus TaxID=568069 RepID=A0A1J1HNE0_9DIPT|nr:CLUMA_CG002806, isoform A [Clunio marinus]